MEMHSKLSFLPILYDNGNVLVHIFHFENIFDHLYILVIMTVHSMSLQEEEYLFFKGYLEYKMLSFFEQMPMYYLTHTPVFYLQTGWQ